MDEETKQRLLEELRKEYKVELKPLTPPKFTVSDIMEKYYSEIKGRLAVNPFSNYVSKETMFSAIRRTMCLKYRVWTTKDIPVDKREQFRQDLEKFITDFILKED